MQEENEKEREGETGRLTKERSEGRMASSHLTWFPRSMDTLS